MNRKNKSTRRLIFGYSTIGIQLAVTLLLFVYGGYRLDNYYKTTPLFVIAGTIIGMIAGFYNLLQGIKQIEESTKREKEEVNNTKSKWL
ncbi:MAG: AtpZ/AtpI family protein [Spirochaetota bacterium]|nr:AtpZ/AtpI family protein [Spirochaetota bacterium]